MGLRFENSVWRANIYKETQFNNVVLTNSDGLVRMTDEFENIFSNYSNFSDTVSTIMFLPLVEPTSPEFDEGYLSTAKGNFETIKVKPTIGSNYLQNLGQFEVKNFYNNFADYKGYTFIKAFLPFLGWVDIDVNECMGKWLHFLAYFDYTSGDCTYIIGVTNKKVEQRTIPFEKDYKNLVIISTFVCKFGVEIPVGRSNASDIVRNNIMNGIKTAVSIGAAIYTSTLPIPTETTTTTTSSSYDMYGRSKAKGSRMKQLEYGTSTTTSTTTKTIDKQFNPSKPISEAIDCSVDILNRTAPSGHTDRANNASNLFFSPTQVQIRIYRPRIMQNTKEYNRCVGKPVGFASKLGNFSGYTEISSIHLEGDGFVTATSEELEELEAILLSPKGIILDGGNPETLPSFYIDDEYSKNKFYMLPKYTWDDFISSPFNIDRRILLEGEISGDESYVVLYREESGVYSPINNIFGDKVYSNDLIGSYTYTTY